jgi:hypothetical protein
MLHMHYALMMHLHETGGARRRGLSRPHPPETTVSIPDIDDLERRDC